jgi:hypothetical protein
MIRIVDVRFRWPAQRLRAFQRITALAATGTALGLVSAPAAQADEISFLQALNTRGIVVYNTSAVLSNGYLACNMMNTETGDIVAAEILYRFPAEATINTAATLVITAAQELCPWHWHPQGAAPTPPPPLLTAT